MRDNTVLSITKPADALTEVLREGAIKLLHSAIEAEDESLLTKHVDMLTLTGRRAVVRNGYLPAREIQKSIIVFILYFPPCTASGYNLLNVLFVNQKSCKGTQLFGNACNFAS